MRSPDSALNQRTKWQKSGPDEPIFGTLDGTFRDPRTVTRWLQEARQRHGFAPWVTFHAWRKTTATVLDEGGATARMIADQLGHSRVSMTQDIYLGRRNRESRVVAALELADPTESAIRGAKRGV